MLKIYPAIFHEENGYWVEWPDLEGCNTCGETLEETMELAQEAMGLYLASLIEDSNNLPHASNLKDISQPEDGIVSYVTTDVSQYVRNTKAVKKTLSIPQWLSEAAERENISLSKVLQEGLRQKLEI